MAYFTSGEDFARLIIVSDDAESPFVNVRSIPRMPICRRFVLGEMTTLLFELDFSSGHERLVETPCGTAGARALSALSRPGRPPSTVAVTVSSALDRPGWCRLRLELGEGDAAAVAALRGGVARGSIRFANDDGSGS